MHASPTEYAIRCYLENGSQTISNQPKPTAQTDLIESTQIPYIIIIHIILCGIIIRIYIIDRFATQRK